MNNPVTAANEAKMRMSDPCAKPSAERYMNFNFGNGISAVFATQANNGIQIAIIVTRTSAHRLNSAAP